MFSFIDIAIVNIIPVFSIICSEYFIWFKIRLLVEKLNEFIINKTLSQTKKQRNDCCEMLCDSGIADKK